MFGLINTFNTDSCRFAYRELGNAARFQVAIALRNHVAMVAAGTAEDFEKNVADGRAASLHGEHTLDERNHADQNEVEGAEVELLNREENGYTVNLSPLKRAALLEAVAVACEDEAMALGGKAPYDTPQPLADIVDFFSRSERPRNLTPLQQQAIDRMIDKGLLQKETVEANRKNDAAKQAQQWRDNGEAILREYDCLDVSQDAEDALDQLEPWMVVRLYDKTIDGMRRQARRFAENIATGKIRDRSPIDAENTVVIVDGDAEALMRVRREFYKQHRVAIEANGNT